MGVEVLRITAEKMVGIDTDHGVEVPFGKGQGMSFGPEGDNGVFKPEVPEPRKVVRRVYPQVRGKHPHAECPCEVYRAQPHAAPQVEHAHIGRKGDVCGQFFGDLTQLGPIMVARRKSRSNNGLDAVDVGCMWKLLCKKVSLP